jgi:hypothetical protein
MKYTILTFCLSALFILNTSTSKALEKSNNLNQESETRTAKNFHAIASGGPFNIIVKMSDEESLKIEGDEEDLQRIETVVQNGTLKIRYKRDFKNWNSSLNKVNIYITAIKLDGLMQSGSGLITLDGVIASASAEFQLSGSGEIIAAVETQSTDVAVSGSGSLKLEGKTGILNIVVSGSGSVKAADLICETGNVKLLGSGDIVLNAEEEINAKIVGSGDVKYLGNPNVTISKFGSGTISKMK